MKKYTLAAIFAFIITVAGAAVVPAQETFSDPNVDYSFSLPDAKWKIITKPSATSPNVEYVYGDRLKGHLEVRRLTTEKNTLTSDVVREDEEKTQFALGYIAGLQENFAGKLRGMIFNFEFVRSGRPMAGRYYFLRADDTTVYVLRFTASKDNLRAIQAQTDAIARTFSVSH